MLCSKFQVKIKPARQFWTGCDCLWRERDNDNFCEKHHSLQPFKEIDVKVNNVECLVLTFLYGFRKLGNRILQDALSIRSLCSTSSGITRPALLSLGSNLLHFRRTKRAQFFSIRPLNLLPSLVLCPFHSWPSTLIAVVPASCHSPFLRSSVAMGSVSLTLFSSTAICRL